MNTSIEMKSILTMLFAQESNTENLKNLANNICLQIKEVYESRYAEIKGNPSKPETSKAEAKSKTKSEGKKTSKAEAKTPEPAKTKAKNKADTDADKVMDTIDLKEIKKLGLTFEKYSDWCWVLRGETKPLRKILKEKFKGVYNSRLSGGEGWVIKTDNVKECAKTLGIDVNVA